MIEIQSSFYDCLHSGAFCPLAVGYKRKRMRLHCIKLSRKQHIPRHRHHHLRYLHLNPLLRLHLLHRRNHPMYDEGTCQSCYLKSICNIYVYLKVVITFEIFIFQCLSSKVVNSMRNDLVLELFAYNIYKVSIMHILVSKQRL